MARAPLIIRGPDCTSRGWRAISEAKVRASAMATVSTLHASAERGCQPAVFSRLELLRSSASAARANGAGAVAMWCVVATPRSTVARGRRTGCKQEATCGSLAPVGIGCVHSQAAVHKEARGFGGSRGRCGTAAARAALGRATPRLARVRSSRCPLGLLCVRCSPGAAAITCTCRGDASAMAAQYEQAGGVGRRANESGESQLDASLVDLARCRQSNGHWHATPR